MVEVVLLAVCLGLSVLLYKQAHGIMDKLFD